MTESTVPDVWRRRRSPWMPFWGTLVFIVVPVAGLLLGMAGFGAGPGLGLLLPVSLGAAIVSGALGIAAREREHSAWSFAGAFASFLVLASATTPPAAYTAIAFGVLFVMVGLAPQGPMREVVMISLSRELTAGEVRGLRERVMAEFGGQRHDASSESTDEVQMMILTPLRDRGLQGIAYARGEKPPAVRLYLADPVDKLSAADRAHLERVAVSIRMHLTSLGLETELREPPLPS